MEYLLVAVIGLAIPICAIAAFAMALGLRRDIARLEARLARTEAELRSRAAGAMASEASDASPGAVEPAPAPPTAPAAEPEPVPELPAAWTRAEPRSPVPAVSPPRQQAPRATASRPLEEQLGTRWAVWIGGLALALGGVFLVRYSIEQGVLGPTARIAAGAFFALALIAAGEWARRREISLNLPGLASAHIPSVLTAAGTLTAFATVYASHALYGLIGPAVAFLLLGAIAILTVVAAALHGPALAGLGLAASLATPLLVSSDKPNFWPVVLYLAVAVGASYGMARLRLWRWLGLTAALGALLWGLVMLVSSAEIGPSIAHLALQLGLAAYFLVAEPHRSAPDGEVRPDCFGSAVLLGFALLAVMIVSTAAAGDGRPIVAGLTAAALLGLALRFPAVAPAAAWAGLVIAGTLALWPVAAGIAAEPLTVFPVPFAPTTPATISTFLTFAAALSGLVSILGLRRVERGRSLPLPLAGWLAGAAILTPLACLVIAYIRITKFAQDIPFALAALALALAFTAVTQRLRRAMTETLDGLRIAVGSAAAGGLAALALGLTFVLDKGMLTVAFALTGLGTAWVSSRLAVPGLRHAVAAVGILVLTRLAWSPTVVGGDPGPLPIFNWLLWGYGAPALSFLLAARLLERSGRDVLVRFVESLSIIFAAFLVFFEIRHAVHGSITQPTTGHLEAGLVATSTFGFALVLMRADIRRADPVYQVGSMIFTGLAVILATFGVLVRFNPLLTGEPILGGPVLNSLLPAYLLPAVLAGGLAVAARGHRPQAFVWGVAALALILHLAYMGLAIRRIFHGAAIPLSLQTGASEQWSYSLALLACGLAMLAVGLLWNLRFLRLASAVYLALAVLKVFIIDLSNLEGIMRALSFIGLGLTLIGIALVYQRLLARRPEDARPA